MDECANPEMEDLVSLNCPICFNQYSDPSRYPRIHPGCGHSFCTECLQKMLDMNTGVKCGTCAELAHDDSFKKNFNLMSLVTELQATQQIVDAGKAECAGCKSKFPEAKMRICTHCATWQKSTMECLSSDEISPFVFCSECALDEHSQKGHKLDRYVVWRQQSELLLLEKDVSTELGQAMQMLQELELQKTDKINEFKAVFASLCKSETCKKPDIIANMKGSLGEISQALDNVLSVHRTSNAKIKKVCDDLHQLVAK